MITIQEGVTELEKEPYIRSLVAIAYIDGLLESEKEYINFQAGLLDIDPEPYWSEDTVDIRQMDFSKVSEITKRVILRDSIVIAHLDSEYTQKENVFVKQIASQMGLSEELILKIESWLLEYWAILEEGNELFDIKGK